MRKLSILCLVVVAVPAIALAQPKSADDFYKEGETQYNLGNFLPAVEAFKKGFELEPSESKKAAYLYNVAQAYRQAKDCSQAQFFYKRYLALKENDQKKPLRPEKRQEIEDRIKELDECARQQEAIRNRPPDQNLRPDDNENKDPDKNANNNKVTPPDKVIGQLEDEEAEEDDGIEKGAAVERPRLVSIRVIGGGAKVTAGDVDVPLQATFALIGGYPFVLTDQMMLDLGAGFGFTPVPYEQMGMSKTATLSALFANVGFTFLPIPKLGVRADVGAGALFFGNISNSTFTANQETTGALTMGHFRFGISADYSITPNFIATLAPIAFSYSPAKEGLRDDINAITAIDFMIGLGYRM